MPTPAGYSHAVSIPSGRLVWTAGHVGTAGDGWEAQTREVFENVGRALEAAGAAWPDVVKVTIYVLDVAELQLIRRVRDDREHRRAADEHARAGRGPRPARPPDRGRSRGLAPTVGKIPPSTNVLWMVLTW